MEDLWFWLDNQHTSEEGEMHYIMVTYSKFVILLQHFLLAVKAVWCLTATEFKVRGHIGVKIPGLLFHLINSICVLTYITWSRYNLIYLRRELSLNESLVGIVTNLRITFTTGVCPFNPIRPHIDRLMISPSVSVLCCAVLLSLPGLVSIACSSK